MQTLLKKPLCTYFLRQDVTEMVFDLEKDFLKDTIQLWKKAKEWKREFIIFLRNKEQGLGDKVG